MGPDQHIPSPSMTQLWILLAYQRNKHNKVIRRGVTVIALSGVSLNLKAYISDMTLLDFVCLKITPESNSLHWATKWQTSFQIDETQTEIPHVYTLAKRCLTTLASAWPSLFHLTKIARSPRHQCLKKYSVVRSKLALAVAKWQVHWRSSFPWSSAQPGTGKPNFCLAPMSMTRM